MEFLPRFATTLGLLVLFTVTGCAIPTAGGGDDTAHVEEGNDVGGPEEYTAGHGQVIDGDGVLQALVEESLERVRFMLVSTVTLPVETLSDLHGCHGFGETFCPRQQAMTAEQRQRSAAAIAAYGAAILDQYRRIFVRVTPGPIEATGPNGEPILVNARISPRFWNVIEVSKSLVEATKGAGLAAATARKEFEQILIHEMMHTVTVAEEGETPRRHRDYDKVPSFTGQGPGEWRAMTYGAARAITGWYDRTQVAPLQCSVSMQPSMDIPLDVDDLPQVSEVSVGFGIQFQVPDRAALTASLVGGGVSLTWELGATPGTAGGTARIAPPTGSRTVRVEIRDRLTGSTNTCEASIFFRPLPVPSTPLFRHWTPLNGGGNVFSYTTDGTVPPGWTMDGQLVGKVAQRPTAKCQQPISMLAATYSNGVAVGTGSILLPTASGGSFIGYVCASPLAGQLQLRTMKKRTEDMYVVVATEAEYQSYVAADWTLLPNTFLGWSF